jgi:hypothetical protein
MNDNIKFTVEKGNNTINYLDLTLKLTFSLSMTTAMMAAAVTTLVVVTIWAAATSSPARCSPIAPSLI